MQRQIVRSVRLPASVVNVLFKCLINDNFHMKIHRELGHSEFEPTLWLSGVRESEKRRNISFSFRETFEGKEMHIEVRDSQTYLFRKERKETEGRAEICKLEECIVRRRFQIIASTNSAFDTV